MNKDIREDWVESRARGEMDEPGHGTQQTESVSEGCGFFTIIEGHLATSGKTSSALAISGNTAVAQVVVTVMLPAGVGAGTFGHRSRPNIP